MGKAILIVEDDPDMRDWIGLHLRNAGYTVRSVANGLQALNVKSRVEAAADEADAEGFGRHESGVAVKWRLHSIDKRGRCHSGRTSRLQGLTRRVAPRCWASRRSSGR